MLEFHQYSEVAWTVKTKFKSQKKKKENTYYEMAYLSGTAYNEEEKIWSGPRCKETYSREMTVGEAIVLQLRKTPKKVIQILESTGESLTAQDYLDHSMSLARNILDMGVQSGDIVGIYAKHSLHLATVILASFLCGTPIHGVYDKFEKGNENANKKI